MKFEFRFPKLRRVRVATETIFPSLSQMCPNFREATTLKDVTKNFLNSILALTAAYVKMLERF